MYAPSPAGGGRLARSRRSAASSQRRIGLAGAGLVAVVVVERLRVARQEDLIDIVINRVEVQPPGDVVPEEVELLGRLHTPSRGSHPPIDEVDQPRRGTQDVGADEEVVDIDGPGQRSAVEDAGKRQAR